MSAIIPTDKMRSISLHIKTTLLSSVVIVFVMAATLVLFGSRVVRELQTEQKEISEVEASSLADNISRLPAPRDYSLIASSIELVRQARRDKDEQDQIRVWERAGGVFVKRVANPNDVYSSELNDEIKAALRAGIAVKIEEDELNGTVYHVLVPIWEGNRVGGAVESIERIDNTWTLLARYLWSQIWLALLSVAFLSASIYGLFQYFVYRPLDTIASAMRRAKGGELSARVAVKSDDEIGELGNEFNRMLLQIGEMTEEREAQQEILRERVKDATTELSVRNEQLETANLEIWETTRRLSELERLASAGQTAAQFAHEVGTPLNLISGHVQLLRMNLDGNEAAQNRLNIITAQIERIEKIVRAMLDRTRFGETEFEKLDLNSILRRIFAVVAPTLESKNIRLMENLAANLSPISGNTEHLQQVFINLINNAVDAMPNGGELNIETSESDDFICVCIKDTGTGMDETTKSRIFEPLFTTKQRGQGTGLGLVVVREILQEHQGEINVESAPEKGTIFQIKFPAIKE